MQITKTDVQTGDMVLDSAKKAWRYDGPDGAVHWSEFQPQAGSMSGPEPDGPADTTLTLLVRDGHQYCCTPDAEPV